MADTPKTQAQAASAADGFKAAVLAWLIDEGMDAVSVEQVSGYGTDWEGDTESGFFSSFGVTVRYTNQAGDTRAKEVTGDDMESLWIWVMKAWPSLW
jgi:hypothetical protein